jgi:hypothetical protein
MSILSAGINSIVKSRYTSFNFSSNQTHYWAQTIPSFCSIWATLFILRVVLISKFQSVIW